MFLNTKYMLCDQDVHIPAHLNFGKYILDRLPIDSNRVAIENIQTKEKLTYKELRESAVHFAILLTKLGVKNGEIVALGTEKHIKCIPLILAIVLTGATFTPHDINSGRALFKHKINITQPKYFICSKKFLEQYHSIMDSYDCVKMILTFDEPFGNVASLNNMTLGDVNKELFEPAIVSGQTDVALILYSSGTTGLTKGVKITHLNCILDNVSDDDDTLKVAYLTGDWYDHYGILMAFRLLKAGKKVLFTENWCTDDILRCIHEQQVNIIFLWPTFISFLIKEGNVTKYNLDSLKTVYSTASPLHKDTINKLNQRLPKLQLVLQGYGMTETGMITSELRGHKGPKKGSVGKAVPGIILKISDLQTEELLGPNKRGEIRVRGPKVMVGYIGTDHSDYCDEEGFFKTGDLGYYDEDGYFYIVGRVKETIDYNGENVSPMELETLLLLHPAVYDAGVVGKQVPVFGEEPTAFVVKQPGSDVTEQELVDYIAQEVPNFMQIRGGIRFIDQIPRNSTGKILRQKLKDFLNEN